MNKILIVGAGFSGATFARLAAESNFDVTVIDKKNHIGGNSYSYKDEETGIEIHKYGSHIFHTNSKEIWEFVNRFASFNNYIHKVKAKSCNSIFPMPINLFTINQFFKQTFTPIEAEKFIESKRVVYDKISNFEEYITGSIGVELYEAFFKYYTAKQWGEDPKKIAVSTAKRLPIRFYYNDNYFDDKYQGIPEDGYGNLFKRMLDHENIKIQLEADFSFYRSNWRNKFSLLVYTGSVDEYFNYLFGKLPYRTVWFKEIRDKEIQGCSVLNYTDNVKPFTRIHEHKWYTPDRTFENSIAFEEYSELTDSTGDPYYPIRNPTNDNLFFRYESIAKTEKDVIFIGRLAEYKYYDMHQVIGSSMAKFRDFITEKRANSFS